MLCWTMDIWPGRKLVSCLFDDWLCFLSTEVCLKCLSYNLLRRFVSFSFGAFSVPLVTVKLCKFWSDNFLISFSSHFLLIVNIE